MQGEGVTRIPIEDDAPPSYAVIAALEQHLDRRSEEFQPPLQSVIDPDALDRIAESSDAEIEFRYQGCNVRVTEEAVVVGGTD